MKRSRDVIISQILDICLIGTSKSQIIKKAELNYRTAGPYLDLLTKNGLLRTVEGRIVTYETTAKGCDLLERFKHIQSELSS